MSDEPAEERARSDEERPDDEPPTEERPTEEPRRLKWAFLVAIVAVGIPAGIGLFTFDYAEGLSYFSTDPAACANCHIMQPQYDGWQHSSHHTAATCVDCHLPQDFVGKYIAKAENGWHHSVGFTLQNFHEPITIKPKNERLLHDNCVRCHEGVLHELLPVDTSEPDFLPCVHCHADVGHGPRAGLGGRERFPSLETP